MENTESPPSDSNTVTPPPLELSPPSDYDHDNQARQQFSSNFTTLYYSIFPPKLSPSPSPSPSPLPSTLSFSFTPSTASPSSSSAATDDFDTTSHRLRQASLILQYQQLCDHYDRCVSRLHSLSTEIEALRKENNDLRLVNINLVKLLGISSQASVHNRRENIVEPDRFERRNNVERVTLPKSISVRSSGYSKTNRTGSSSSNRPRTAKDNLYHLISRSQKVRVPGNKRSEEAAAVEMEVYNQGMWKTELCNKWEETGECPYGDHCRFAHGITELRPVIRHPRYKTQVCRMVVAGEVCPYGHRCHFRHSLTDQDRQI